MDPISQEAALAETALQPGEHARIFTAARFATHAYAPHAHETYAIGIIEAGCEIWHARGCRMYARAGDVVFCHPLDVHDGSPHEGGYRYRMSYPTVALLRDIATSLTGRDDICVLRARDRLRKGEAPGAVAAATGFCDQAHLTRAFKARLGVTLGAFRAAHLV